MRRAFIFLIGLATIPAALTNNTRATLVPQSFEHGGKIHARYDGFNNETIITLRKMRISCGRGKGLPSETCVNVAATLHAPGKQLERVRYVTLELIFESKDWDRRHTPEQRELAIVADGETIRLGKMTLVNQDLDTDRMIDVMKEVLQISISYKDFAKIARAEFVEIRVGNSEFVLQQKNLAALRDLNNRVVP